MVDHPLGAIPKQLQKLAELENPGLKQQQKAWTQLDNNGYNILMLAAIQPNEVHLKNVLDKVDKLPAELQTALWTAQARSGHNALELIILQHPERLSEALGTITEFAKIPVNKLLPAIATSTVAKSDLNILFMNTTQEQVEKLLTCRLPLKTVLPIFKRIQKIGDKNFQAKATDALLNKLLQAWSESGEKAVSDVFNYLTENKYPNVSKEDKRDYLSLEMTLRNQQVMPLKGSGLFAIFKTRSGTKRKIRREQRAILNQYQATESSIVNR